MIGSKVGTDEAVPGELALGHRREVERDHDPGRLLGACGVLAETDTTQAPRSKSSSLPAFSRPTLTFSITYS